MGSPKDRTEAWDAVFWNKHLGPGGMGDSWPDKKRTTSRQESSVDLRGALPASARCGPPAASAVHLLSEEVQPASRPAQWERDHQGSRVGSPSGIPLSSSEREPAEGGSAHEVPQNRPCPLGIPRGVTGLTFPCGPFASSLATRSLTREEPGRRGGGCPPCQELGRV